MENLVFLHHKHCWSCKNCQSLVETGRLQIGKLSVAQNDGWIDKQQMESLLDVDKMLFKVGKIPYVCWA